MLWRYVTTWKSDGTGFRVRCGDKLAAQALVRDLGAGRVEGGTAIFQGQAMLKAAPALGMPEAVSEAVGALLSARLGRGVERSVMDVEAQQEASQGLSRALARAARQAEEDVRTVCEQ